MVLVGFARAIDVNNAVSPLPASGAHVDLVQRFYEAANAVMETGDTSHIDPYVAPDYLEHSGGPLAKEGRDQLAQALLSRHETFPGMRLVVDHIRADIDHVTARVHAELGGAGTFFGLSVPDVLGLWGPVDLLRIDGGLVVERWSGQPDVARFDPLWRVPAALVSPDTVQTVALRRITWEPGAAVTIADNPAAWFLVAETGQLTAVAGSPAAFGGGPPTIRRGGTDGDSGTLGAGGRTVLAAGDLFDVPIGAGFSLVNEGPLPAQAVLVAMWAPMPRRSDRAPTPGELAMEQRAADLGFQPGLPASTMLAAGVESRVLTTVQGIDLLRASTMTLARIVLAPGDTLGLPGSAAPLILANEAGQAELVLGMGRVGAVAVDARTQQPGTMVTLAPGEGATVWGNASGVWRSVGDEPSVTLVLTTEG